MGKTFEVTERNMEKQTTEKSWVRKCVAHVVAPLELIVILAAAYIVALFLPDAFRNRMCIIPRELDGLAGILFHPLLHFSTAHLILNCLGLFILGGLLAISTKKAFFAITALSWIAGGAILWGIGNEGLHAGASGIVFGYLGFLMSRGFFDRRFLPILLSIITIYFFYGMLAGMVPTDQSVSWEGHISGFIVGCTCAFLSPIMQKRRIPKSEKEKPREDTASTLEAAPLIPKEPPLPSTDETKPPPTTNEDKYSAAVDERLNALKKQLGQ